MTDILLLCIVVILALNLAVNVSAWSRKSAAYHQLRFWLRGQARRWPEYWRRMKRRRATAEE